MLTDTNHCRHVLKNYARMLRAIRAYFDEQGFTEVHTPVRVWAPALEEHIDAIPSGNVWLRTSPELHMKRLLAAGCERIYQIGPCFRHGEFGARHNPEFLMLEWYRANADYRDILSDVKNFIPDVIRHVTGSALLTYQNQQIACATDWHTQTVAQAFSSAAGWDPTRQFDVDRFDLDLINKVEPQLPTDRPTVLMDYPAPAAALARCRSGSPPIAERWELYIGGLEIANAFSELTDPAEQRRRFEACAAWRRDNDRPAYPLDHDFLAALQQGMPPSAGAALGLDRLAMLLCDVKTLDEVLPFRIPS